MNKLKLSACCIMTNDLVGLVKFYMSVLPMAVQDQEFDESDRYIEIRMENINIAIVSMKQDNHNLFTASSNKSIMLGFQVEDVDAEYDRIISLGIEIVKPLETMPWGSRSFYFKDPDDNVICFDMAV